MALLEVHHYDHHTSDILARTKGIKKSNYKPSHKVLIELPEQEYGEDGFDIVEGYLKLECRLDISCFTDDINKIKADILKHNYESKRYEIIFVSDTIVDRIRVRR
ncbi:MAG: hypothetical protein ACRC41_18240 [Sarcina sp.]